ncbi:hypothetical protein SZN_35197, partial [Streptomyces zinciresistens K42]
VGGVAVAAGTGVLPTSFRGGEPARPGASVTSGVPPETPLVSPSPDGGAQGGPTPGGGSGAPSGTVTAGTSPGGPARGGEPSADARDRGTSGWWKTVVSSCRDVRNGKPLDDVHRRALQGAAGGAERVRPYCNKILKLTGGNAPGRSVPERAGGRGGDGPAGQDGDDGRGGDRDGPHRGGGRGPGPFKEGGRTDHRTDGGTGGPSLTGRPPDGGDRGPR